MEIQGEQKPIQNDDSLNYAQITDSTIFNADSVIESNDQQIELPSSERLTSITEILKEDEDEDYISEEEEVDESEGVSNDEAAWKYYRQVP
jgi:hypothetical protein